MKHVLTMGLLTLTFSTPCLGIEITPREFKGFLQIPGVGFQTWHRYLDTDANTRAAFPNSGSAYFRWYWDTLEPTEGNYNFELIDGTLKRARENNQTLEFRFMILSDGGGRLPTWLKNKGVKHVSATNFPDLEDPVLKAAHYKLVRAIGKRYDGHPDLGSVDMGSVGFWGEWHTWTHPQAMPSASEQKSVIDLYVEAFPNTPLVSLVGMLRLPSGNKSTSMLEYSATRANAAWRGDCWGDTRNHQQNWYEPANKAIPNAWKKGSVNLETCHTMSSWLSNYSTDEAGIKTIVDQAINWHATLAHNKASAIPAMYQKELERLAMKLGFRMVLRKATFREDIGLEGTNIISLDWENLGIAPPYRDYRVAFRLVNSAGQKKAMSITELSIKGWLPGDTSVRAEYSLPANSGVSAGETYELQMALVFHSASDRTVPIAIEGRTSDEWYPLSDVKIVNVVN